MKTSNFLKFIMDYDRKINDMTPLDLWLNRRHTECHRSRTQTTVNFDNVLIKQIYGYLISKHYSTSEVMVWSLNISKPMLSIYHS